MSSGFNMYLDSGYANMGGILDLGFPFTLAIGGRGIGKTYTTLKELRVRKRNPILLRRTQQQADIIARKSMSPWRSIARDEGFDYACFPMVKGITETVELDADGQILNTLSVNAALTTFSNTRGFDSSDIDTIYFDEFIPERAERPIKNEFETLINAYETVARNRELSGKKPVQLIMTANANRLDSPILMGFGVTSKIESMIKKGQSYSLLPDRGIALFLFQDSPISARKSETALYRAMKGTAYSDMALNNAFAYDDTSNVISRPLDGLEPVLRIDDVTIYKNKSTNKFYASKHCSGTPPRFSTLSEEDVKRVTTRFYWIALQILANNIEYESFECKALILQLFLQ